MSAPSIERNNWKWFWNIYLHNRPPYRYLSYEDRIKFDRMKARRHTERFFSKEKVGNEDELYVPLEERRFTSI